MKSNMKSGFTVVEAVVIVFLIAVVVAGITITKKKTATSTDAGQVTTEPTITPATTAAKKTESKTSTAAKTDKTADWTTFSSTKYGFSFKYPANWFVDTHQSAPNDPSNPIVLGWVENIKTDSNAGYPDKNHAGVDITVGNKDTVAQWYGTSYTEYFKKYMSAKNASKETRTINGNAITIYSANDDSPDEGLPYALLSASFEHGDNFIVLQGTLVKGNQLQSLTEEIDRIFQTIKTF